MCVGGGGGVTLRSLPLGADFQLQRAGQRAKILPPICTLGVGLIAGYK